MIKNVEIMKLLAEKEGITVKKARDIIDTFVELIKGELEKGEGVRVLGLGNFITRDIAARKGINPQNRKPLIQKAYTKVVFKVFRPLKKALQK